MRQDGYYFYKRRKRFSDDLVHEIFHWFLGIFISVILALVLVYFMGVSFIVSGESMSPGLVDGQKVLVNDLIYKFTQPKPGDVIVFLPNGNSNLNYYVKRVVAVPGDRIYVMDGNLYVNDVLSDVVTDKIIDPGLLSNEITVSQGTYFVMSDDVSDADDSRNANIGPVENRYIEGKVWFAFSKDDSKMHLVD
ncbi:MAG: signal peptidase I [Lachnospiraceae bacterium]|nr:signal peptidase I [Lachnospiraceae bacterium]